MDTELFDMASEEAEQLVKQVISVYKKAREEQSLSLRAIAIKAGLDVTLLSRAEQNQRIPSFSFFVDLGDALGIPLEQAIKKARSQLKET